MTLITMVPMGHPTGLRKSSLNVMVNVVHGQHCGYFDLEASSIVEQWST